jgi:hypothetical protein
LVFTDPIITMFFTLSLLASELASRSSIRLKVTAGQGVQPQEYK